MAILWTLMFQPGTALTQEQSPPSPQASVLRAPADDEVRGIEVVLSAELHAPFGSDAEGDRCDSMALAESKGKFFLSATCLPPGLTVFDSEGHPLPSLNPVLGNGETALESVYRLFSSADGNLHVFGLDTGHTIIEPASAVVRKRFLPLVPFHAIVEWSERDLLILQTPNPPAYQLNPAVAVASGRVLYWFGAHDESGWPAGQTPVARMWPLASGVAPNSVWIAHPNRYEIDRWHITKAGAQLVARLSREAEWFPSWSTLDPMSPVLRYLRQDDEGLLWTMTMVPDPNLLSRSATPPRDVPAPWHARRDTIIEVVDPVSRAVVATHRSDLLLEGWLGDKVWSVKEARNGQLVVQIWALDLAVH